MLVDEEEEEKKKILEGFLFGDRCDYRVGDWRGSNVLKERPFGGIMQEKKNNFDDFFPVKKVVTRLFELFKVSAIIREEIM